MAPPQTSSTKARLLAAAAHFANLGAAALATEPSAAAQLGVVKTVATPATTAQPEKRRALPAIVTYSAAHWASVRAQTAAAEAAAAAQAEAASSAAITASWAAAIAASRGTAPQGQRDPVSIERLGLTGGQLRTARAWETVMRSLPNKSPSIAST
jgi:hypothetical protein